MLSVQGYIDLLNDKNRKMPKFMDKWHQVYYGMSLHIDGVCPYYYSIRDTSLGWIDSNLSKIFPTNCGDVEHQALFENVHFNRHPREPEIIRNWRKSQYKPFTQDPFLQAIQVITGAIFQDSSYQLKIEDKDDNDYIWGNNFDDKTLIQFISDNFQQITEDPNGLFVVIPKEPYYKTTTNRIEPNLHFIQSKHIKHFDKDEIVFCIDDVYWAVNTESYYRFIKKGDKYILHPDDRAKDGYFAHLLGMIPAVKAGGLWNSQGYYDSWLNAAKPIADEFIGAKSAEQLVNKEASHPVIVSSSDECPDCTGGKVNYCTTCNSNDCSCELPTFSVRTCGTCNGTGEISVSPGQWKIVPIEDMDKDAVKFIAPPVDINKFHAENNKELYNGILRALHLHYIEEAQSGKAKDKDMETRYQFILKISNDLFDRVITKLINYITSLRNVSSNGNSIVPAPKPFVLVKPTQFQIKTAQDLLTEYETATKALIPDYIRKAQVRDYTDKQYGGDEVQNKKVWFVNQKDIFAVSSMEDINSSLINGVDHRKFQLHVELDCILDKVIRERSQDWFLKAKYNEIEIEVDRIFNEIVPSSTPQNIVRTNTYI